MKKITIATLFSVLCFQLFSQTATKEYYLIKVYHCSDLQQINNVEEYVGKQLIPFLHQNKVEKVGVFKPVDNDTLQDKKLLIWMPLHNLESLTHIENSFEQINPLGNDAMIHLDSSRNKAPYTRIETMLSKAFKLMPHYNVAATFERSSENIYEFRSYESTTEDLHLRKVHMFNEGGEIALFARLNFNAVFYARVIVGNHMPNLVYMTRFKNKADRDEHWKTFGGDPEWKRMSTSPQYVNTVSKHDITLMNASAYSEF